MSTDSIADATGRMWGEWVVWLDEAGARGLDHPQIARLVHTQLDGAIESAGWWAQGITVAYEQYIGRRQPGQKNDGTYELAVTKTIPGTKEDVAVLWADTHISMSEARGVGVTNVRTSTTPVRCYWRCDLSDGSRVSVATEERSPARAMISVTHTKLMDTTDVEAWRSFWKAELEKL